VALVSVLLLSVPVLAGCGRGETLGPDEAVEVLVLDGVDRGQAVCMVTALDGRLDLDRVTGLEVDLDEDQVALLAETSASCAPVRAAGGGVVESSGGFEDPVAALAMTDPPPDLGLEIERLIEGGLEVDVATCLQGRLELEDDPGAAVQDRFLTSAMIVACRDDLAGPAGARGR
jgi:hypothetical protein